MHGEHGAALPGSLTVLMTKMHPQVHQDCSSCWTEDSPFQRAVREKLWGYTQQNINCAAQCISVHTTSITGNVLTSQADSVCCCRHSDYSITVVTVRYF